MLCVVTREGGRNESVRAWLPATWDVLEVPVTMTRYEDHARVDAAVGRAKPFSTVVVTSARAASYLDGVGAARVVAVGATTARALAEAGRRVDGVGGAGALELLDVIGEGPVLVLGARNGRPELVDALCARGQRVEVVECYVTVAVELGEDARAALERADVIVVGAPSAWRAARASVDQRAWVVVPGATTAAAVAADHERVIVAWGSAGAGRLAALSARGGRHESRPGEA